MQELSTTLDSEELRRSYWCQVWDINCYSEYQDRYDAELLDFLKKEIAGLSHPNLNDLFYMVLEERDGQMRTAAYVEFEHNPMFDEEREKIELIEDEEIRADRYCEEIDAIVSCEYESEYYTHSFYEPYSCFSADWCIAWILQILNENKVSVDISGFLYDEGIVSRHTQESIYNNDCQNILIGPFYNLLNFFDNNEAICSELGERGDNIRITSNVTPIIQETLRLEVKNDACAG